MYPCVPECIVCSAQNDTAIASPLQGVHCIDFDERPANGLVASYCSGAVACNDGFGGFMCGACADGFALWHGSCVGMRFFVFVVCLVNTRLDYRYPRPGLIAVWFLILWLQVLVINIGRRSAGASRHCCTLCRCRCFYWAPPTALVMRALASGSGSGLFFVPVSLSTIFWYH